MRATGRAGVPSIPLVAFLAACSVSTPAPAPPALPVRVLAALPPDLGPEVLKRRSDGCWFIVIEDGLSGVMRPLKDRNGKLVCDGSEGS